MYERFTDRARKIMQLANQEAQRFNHEYIGTEHILLGIVEEGTGIAAHVLKSLGVELHAIRLEVENRVERPNEGGTHRLFQTPRAKKVIEYAMDEARVLGHQYVGSEHILLGLLRDTESLAAQVLMKLGLHLEQVRAAIRAAPLQSDRISVPATRRTSYYSDVTATSVGRLDYGSKRRALKLVAEIEALQQAKELAVADSAFPLAAQLRDKQDERRKHLAAVEVPEWFRNNIERLHGGFSKFPLLDTLGEKAAEPDVDALALLSHQLKPPVKFVVGIIPRFPVGLLKSSLKSDDVGSPYFLAAVPLISLESISGFRTGHSELLRAAFREIEQAKDPQRGRPVLLCAVRPSALSEDVQAELFAGIHRTACDFVVFEEPRAVQTVREKLPLGTRVLESSSLEWTN